jgi:hypothetical protein
MFWAGWPPNGAPWATPSTFFSDARKASVMDLLDRYLANVALLLPTKSRADILAELRDILLSQQEEREETLGRPLRPLEQEALIKDFGHPLVVAGRYRGDRQLIGPAVYPFWLFSIQVGAAIILCITVLLAILHGLQAHRIATAIPWIFSRLVNGLTILVGITTIIFWVIERLNLTGWLNQWWTPSKMPVVTPKRKSWFELAVEVVFGAVFILIWAGIAPVPLTYWAGPNHQVHLALGPIFGQLYLPILGVAIGRLLANMLELTQLGTGVFRQGFSLIVSLAGVVVVGLLLAGGPWIDITGLPEPADQARAGIELGLGIALICALLGSIIETGWEAIKLWRLTHD